MKQRLARTRVAHLDGVARLDHRFRTEIMVDHDLHRSRAYLRGDISGLELAEYLMDEDPIEHLERDLDEMLVAAVHGIARLKGGHARPSLAGKKRPRLRRA